jgi:hypothetical protein
VHNIGVFSAPTFQYVPPLSVFRASPGVAHGAGDGILR